MAEHVLTLVASDAASGFIASAAEAVAAALLRLGARLEPRDWLGPEAACDLPFDDLNPDQADAAAREIIGRSPIDAVAQPSAHRKKRLLVADMESTIIANEMLDELADLLGLRPRVAAITERAMNGELDFAAALRERVALLKDLPATALDEAGRRIRIIPGAKELVRTMRRHGARTALVSGGFGIYARPIAAELGFDHVSSNEIEVRDGRLTGAAREPIRGRDDKLGTLMGLAGELGLPLALTLAVGDGANDLPMIEAAGLGIAFRGKPAVAARARARIDHADLTALLYVQGYRMDEFVSSDRA